MITYPRISTELINVSREALPHKRQMAVRCCPCGGWWCLKVPSNTSRGIFGFTHPIFRTWFYGIIGFLGNWIGASFSTFMQCVEIIVVVVYDTICFANKTMTLLFRFKNISWERIHKNDQCHWWTKCSIMKPKYIYLIVRVWFIYWFDSSIFIKVQLLHDIERDYLCTETIYFTKTTQSKSCTQTALFLTTMSILLGNF